ncbi:MAG: cyclic nucleotide-binding domain-containing protein [Pseudomonadota bacterium]
MTLANECDQLQTIELFHGLDPSKCKLVAMSSDRLHYAAGDVICRQGDASDAVYFVLSGAVHIVKENEDRSVLLNTMRGGNVLGETGVIRGRGRTATIVAAEETVILKTDGRVFLELLETMPQMGLALARTLATRLNAAGRRVLDATSDQGVNASDRSRPSGHGAEPAQSTGRNAHV